MTIFSQQHCGIFPSILSNHIFGLFSLIQINDHKLTTNQFGNLLVHYLRPKIFWALGTQQTSKTFFHFYVVVYSAAQEWDEKKYQQRFWVWAYTDVLEPPHDQAVDTAKWHQTAAATADATRKIGKGYCKEKAFISSTPISLFTGVIS